MKTVDICGITKYSPLIVAVKAIYTTPKGEELELIMDDNGVFDDLKEFLSEEGFGFREIYADNKRILQFIVK